MIEMTDPNFAEQLNREYSSLKSNRPIVRQLPRHGEPGDPQPGDPNDKEFGDQLRRELEELTGKDPRGSNILPQEDRVSKPKDPPQH